MTEEMRNRLEEAANGYEEWKDIKDYKGQYQVSNIGRVRSLDREVIKSDGQISLYRGKILKQSKTTAGYYMVVLCNVGKQKPARIHRLVAEAFLPNPNNLPSINHKNEIKTDNRVDNLEWCDQKYNSRYGTARERGLATRNRMKVSGAEKPVEQRDFDGTIIATYKSITDASNQTGVGQTNILRACRNIYHHAGGYKWNYKL